MAKPLTNLSIRVNIPEEKEYVVKEEVVILWGRIWAAAGALLLVVALLVVLLLNMAGSETTPAAQTVVDVDVDVPAAPLEAATVEAPSAVATTAKAVPQAVADPLAKAPLSLVDTAVNVAVVPAQPSAASKELAAEAVTEPVAVAPVDAAVTAPVAKTFKPAIVSSSSEHLLRAALATEMKARQPANNAAAVLHVPDGELLTVYFFTELKGLRKQTVHYDWFRNDKRVARVKIRPRFDTTGNFSSKYIDGNMLGQWRVVAKTAAGEMLAAANFEVR